MKTTWIVAILAGVALLAGGFLLLDARAMHSQTLQNTITASAASPSEESTRNLLGPNVSLVVAPGPALAQPLAAALTRRLAELPGMGPVVSLQPEQLEAVSGTPLLAVTVEPEEIHWTPVSSRATVHTSAAFSTLGDVSFVQPGANHFTSPGVPVIQMHISIDTTDRSWGLMTLPAYRRYLAEAITAKVIEALQAQLYSS
ncbi:MAG: hypothetical protein GYA17_19270 [Chloroflexi bacterium]|nr:hypothetical protein [Anaerolineaceae bacterium]NMB90509.1 hypothetical protein [Chloroflexota bacterium]